MLGCGKTSSMTEQMPVEHDAILAARLKTLIEANQALAQVESLDELLPKLLMLGKDVTNAEAASILLYKPETDTLEFTLAVNDFQQEVQQLLSRRFELKMGEGIAGHVALSRRPLLVEDAYKDERFFGKADKASGFVTRSLLCVPIVHRDELLGVFQVLNSRTKTHFDSSDLAILESFGHVAAVALVRSRLLEALLQQERLQAQLDAAASIQANFLPTLPDLSPHAGIWAATKPAIYLGGDFYDCIRMPDGSQLVCVADVSGKGLPAALVGAAIWTRLRGMAPLSSDLGTLLAELNDSMLEVLGHTLFATMIIGRFWPETGETRLALAGHLPPIRCGSNGVSLVEGMRGQPLGITAGAQYEGRTIVLAPGESILFVTDGVTEARNTHREFFGDERVLEHLAAGHAAPPLGQALAEAVETWRGGAEANDDVTVLEFWRSR